MSRLSALCRLASSMKLLVWNINALAPTARNAVHKYGSWAGFFQHHGLDLLALQESKVIDEKLTKELACVDGFQSFWACSREKKGYSGVTTYASEAWAPLNSEADCLGSGDDDIDREGRIVVTDHGTFVLINVYVPNAGDRPARARLPYKLRFLEALRRKCDDLAAAGRQLLIVGDFNIPAEPRDMHPSLGPYDESYGEEERAALAGLMAAYPDVWRRLHPEESSTYTVWNEKTSARAFNQGLRIDYVLASPGLLDSVVSCEVLSAEVLPPKWSDHAGILLELSGVDPPAAHPLCKAWQTLHKRFNDTSQRSILSMFGKKRPAEPAAAGKGAGSGNGDKGAPVTAAGAAASAAAGGGAAEAGHAAAPTGAGGAAAPESSQGQLADEPQEQQQQQEQQPPAKRPRQADDAGAEELSSSNAGAAPGTSGAEAGAAGSGTQQKAGGGGGGRKQAASGGKGKGKAAQNGQPKEAAAGQRTIGSFFKSSQ